MLNPATDRCDYGEMLRAPSDSAANATHYELDAAIATTFSLNLDALLAVPVSLVLGDTLEGDLAGEKIALLEAIGQLSGRVKVFYQRGNIHVPREFNRLFALLEPMLAPIVPVGDISHAAFSSFHPKIWVLRYVNRGTTTTRKVLSVKYRLLVMSRNLTFDRSWDLSASLDGTMSDEAREDDPLAAFVETLVPHAGDFAHMKTFLKELPRVHCQAPAPFRDPRMLPGGGAHIAEPDKAFISPINFGHSVDDLLVVSPFLDMSDKKAIDWLATQTEGRRYLFSRADVLDAIGAQALAAWHCYALNDQVIDGEESLQQAGAATQNLHAKLIVSRSGNVAHWHLGSANATTAALGTSVTDGPRNTEFMLRLTGADQRVGIDTLLAQWTGEASGQIFRPHSFNALTSGEDEKDSRALRMLSHRLVSADWQLEARLAEPERYDLVLTTGFVLPDNSELNGLTVSVGLMCRQGAEWPLQARIEWNDLGLTQLSALVPLIFSNAAGTVLKTFVVQAGLRIVGGDNRAAQVMRELVDTPEKFLNYVRLLLDMSSDKQKWLAADSGDNEIADLFGFDGSNEIFEQLMLAAARNPHHLQRVGVLVKRLQTLKTPIPAQFTKLWGHFSTLAEQSK
jgi:hypothetical protein